MGTSDGLSTDLTQTNMIKLALLDQHSQVANHIFNAHVGIRASGFEEVHLLGAPKGRDGQIDTASKVWEAAETKLVYDT